MAYEIQETRAVRDWTLATPEELTRGYEEMAADKDREREALEWSEALIGDGLETR